MVSEPKDYYAILGVEQDASRESIKVAYRRLAREAHPDMVAAQGDGSERIASERMAELNEAYAVLSRSAPRADYDRTRASAAKATSRVPFVPPEPPPRTGPVADGPRARPRPRGVVVDNVVDAYLGHVRQELIGAGSASGFKEASLEGFDWALRLKSLMAYDWLAVRGFQSLDADRAKRFHRYAETALRETRSLLRANRFLFVVAFYRVDDPDHVMGLFHRAAASIKRASKPEAQGFILLADVARARTIPMGKVDSEAWIEPLVSHFQVRSSRSRAR